MKWISYFVLALIAGVLFLPQKGSGIRNIPLLLGILACIAIFIVYNLLSLLFLTCKVKKCLKKSRLQVEKIRLFIRKGYILAKNGTGTIEVCLLPRRRKFCRYHFSDEKHIEFWKSTRLVVKRSQSGYITKGAVDTRMVGKAIIRWSTLNTEKPSKQMIVMNKLPNNISDSAKKEELSSGDFICSSNIVLFDLDGFINYINKSTQ